MIENNRAPCVFGSGSQRLDCFVTPVPCDHAAHYGASKWSDRYFAFGLGTGVVMPSPTGTKIASLLGSQCVLMSNIHPGNRSYDVVILDPPAFAKKISSKGRFGV
jgi:hypothetical protein